MERKYRLFLTRYLPVLNPKNPSLADIMQRFVWNTGLWSQQSLRLHWLAKLAVICFASMLTSLCFTLINERDDMTQVFECISIIPFCGMGALKLLNLYVNRERWLFMFAQVKTLENEQLNSIKDASYLGNTDEEDHAQRCIEKYTKRHIFISALLLKLYSATVVIFIATPFIELVFAPEQTAGYPHFLPGWAALDRVGIIGYLINILFESVGAIYCVFAHFAFDCASVGIMIFICGQFSLLRYNTENIAGLVQGEVHRLGATRDTRAHFRIIKSHDTHTAICTVIKELDSTLRSILGVYFLVTALTLCSVAIRLNTETLSSMQLVSLLQYMCGTLTQLFLLCRYGDAVFHEVTRFMYAHGNGGLTSSFKPGEGPFGAAWWALRPRVRREVALLGAGMLCPRPLRAGPFNTLDLPSFVQIVKAAYSYYAVLGQTSK